MHMRELIQLEININQKKNDKNQDENITEEDKNKIAMMQDKVGSAVTQTSNLYCQMCVFIIEKHFYEIEYIKNLVSVELALYPKQ